MYTITIYSVQLLLYNNFTTGTEEMKPIDIIAIIIGLVGTILNGILFWVIKRNGSIDKKCAFIYKNLAMVDIFNCLVIPSCFLIIKGTGYTIDLNSVSNSILYLLFGAMIDIPYLLLILLSIARVMIFRKQIFYSQVIQMVFVRVLCILCWLIPIAVSLGIWSCYLLKGNATTDILIYLLKMQATTMLTLIIITLFLISLTLALIKVMIRATCEHNWISPVLVNAELSSDTLETSNFRQVIQRELKSANRTFCFFLINILVCSSYPAVFSFSFFECGPYYESKKPICVPFEKPIFSNPRDSYAYTLISLCGMSIINSIILLQQKSFFVILKQLWIFRIRCIRRENTTVNENQEPPQVAKGYQVPQVPTLPWTRSHETPENMT